MLSVIKTFKRKEITYKMNFINRFTENVRIAMCDFPNMIKSGFAMINKYLQPTHTEIMPNGF